MSLYRNILKQALNITWRYKYLWLFGLFASLLGSGGEYKIINNISSGNTGKNVLPNFASLSETGVFNKETLNNLVQLFKTDMTSMIIILAVGLIVLAIAAVLIWLMIISQATLVNDSGAIINGKKKKNNIKASFIAGKKKFWPVLGLNIIIKIVIGLIFILISLPIILAATKAISSLAVYSYIILFILFIPIAITLSFITKYAIAYVVIKGQTAIESIKSGWELFTKNWLVSIEMAFIIFFINFLISLGTILLIFTLATPFIFLALVLSQLTTFMAFSLTIITMKIIFFAIIILSGTLLTTFQTVAWTDLFLKLINKGGKSKIIRLVEKLKK